MELLISSVMRPLCLKTTVIAQTFFTHPKVTATRKPLLAAKSESNGGRHFRNYTITRYIWQQLVEICSN